MPIYASGREQLIPVENSSERISDPNMDLSILPPSGEGWFIVADNPMGGISFSKAPNAPTHTMVCSLVVVPIENQFQDLESFLRDIKKSKETDTDPRRFKDVMIDVILNDRFGRFSLEYRMQAVDMKKKVKGEPLILKAHGFVFVHPLNPHYVIDISYSERNLEESFTIEMTEIGEQFIDHLQVGGQ